MATKPCRKYIPDPVPVGFDPKLSAWLKREFERVQQGICCCDNAAVDPCDFVGVSRACLWDTSGVSGQTVGTDYVDVDNFESFSATDDFTVDPATGYVTFSESRPFAVEFNGILQHDIDAVSARYFYVAFEEHSLVYAQAFPEVQIITTPGSEFTQVTLRFHIYPGPGQIENVYSFRIGYTSDTYTSPSWVHKILTIESIGAGDPACYGDGCQWAGFDDPNISWSLGDEAWQFDSSPE